MEKELVISEIKRAISIESKAVASLNDTLDMNVMYKIVQLFAECKGRIVFSGCGTSAMGAKKIVHSLNCIERPTLFLTPSDAVHGGLGVLQKEDILVLVSKGGNTGELVKLIPACKTKGATLIGVTENSESVIGKEADVCLVVGVEKEPCRFNMLATASTMAVVSAFDSVCIALMQYMGYTREQFAVIHPSGAVGERLLGGKE